MDTRKEGGEGGDRGCDGDGEDTRDAGEDETGDADTDGDGVLCDSIAIARG